MLNLKLSPEEAARVEKSSRELLESLGIPVRPVELINNRAKVLPHPPNIKESLIRWKGEYYTTEAYDWVRERGSNTGLVKTVITNRLGRKQTVWRRPPEPPKPAPTGKRAEAIDTRKQAAERVSTAVGKPESFTRETIGDFVEDVKRLTKAELQPIRDKLLGPEGSSRLKRQEMADSILEYARNNFRVNRLGTIDEAERERNAVAAAVSGSANGWTFSRATMDDPANMQLRAKFRDVLQPLAAASVEPLPKGFTKSAATADLAKFLGMKESEVLSVAAQMVQKGQLKIGRKDTIDPQYYLTVGPKGLGEEIAENVHVPPETLAQRAKKFKERLTDAWIKFWDRLTPVKESASGGTPTDADLTEFLNSILIAMIDAGEDAEAVAAMLNDGDTVTESIKVEWAKESLQNDLLADLLGPYASRIVIRPVLPDEEDGDQADSDDDGEPVWPEDEAPLSEEEVAEGRADSTFTGEKKDKLGRRMCYANGRRVPCGPKPTARQQRWKDNSTHQQYQPSGEVWDTPKWQPAGVTRTGQRRWLDGDTGKIVYRVGRPKEPTAEEKRAAYEARALQLTQPAKVEIGEGTDRAKTESSLTRMFGDTDPARVATILGVPPGSVVIAQGFQFGDGGQIYTAIQHPDTMSWGRTVTPEDDGTLTIENMSFFLKPSAQGSGFGTKTFSEQVRQGFLQGVGTIETKAGKGGSGSDKMNGYYTWARLGYDAPLEDSFKKRLPAAFRKAETVQDLMEMTGGSDYWKARGHAAYMAFDLTPGSRSLDVLSRYLQSKGQPPIDQSESVIAAREATIQERRKRQPSTQARNREKFIEQETAVWPTLGDTIAKQVNDDRYTTPIIEEFNRQYPESRARYMDSGEHPNVAITEALRNARNVVGRSVYLDALDTPEGDAAKEAFQELADKHGIPNWGRYPVIGRTPVETVALTMASTMELQGAPPAEVRAVLDRVLPQV